LVLFIMAAASGTGKSTLARRLLAAEPRLRLSVSHTTRRPRPGETDGVEYHFVDRERFAARVAEGAFAEWAEYAGNLYGTAHEEIARARETGGDLLFDVEVVGAAALKRVLPDAVSVFVLPPSMAELERRLRGRGTESEEVVARRLLAARRELDSAETFDHLVINDDVERAAEDLRAILRAAGLRTASRRALLDRLRTTV